MSEILTACPVTGRHIRTGLNANPADFNTLPAKVTKIACPHCGGTHSWTPADVWLEDKFDANWFANGCVAFY